MVFAVDESELEMMVDMINLESERVPVWERDAGVTPCEELLADLKGLEELVEKMPEGK